ncbi:hypothetical protein OS965_32230 [Streptomyces sp. H27-G5]|uniref:hypothetical protein n=1 Tax=Streptomyces sp. H27-G5 TaxID=2996698 RepID=UPI00226E7133|nr:hypothetical protein [Streptomyces sp. H27-G5]MCY0922758.1 hypothetical protein [Streptomyces sp. H27-G5]
MTLPMNDVLDAVRAGRTERLPALLGPLTPAERRAVLGELTALRREVRGWGWDRGSERDRMRGALLVAGAGCHTGAAAAASWIGSRELRDWREPPAAARRAPYCTWPWPPGSAPVMPRTGPGRSTPCWCSRGGASWTRR